MQILCPATIIASIMAVNMWKNSLKNVESDNKFLYETLLDFFTAKRYLLSEKVFYIYIYVMKTIEEHLRNLMLLCQ